MACRGGRIPGRLAADEENGGRHASQTRAEHLIVERVAVAPGLMQHGEEFLLRHADVVLVILIDPLERRVAHPAQKHPADACFIGGIGRVEWEIGTKDKMTFRVIHIDDTVARAGGEVHRLAGELAELVNILRGNTSEAAGRAALDRHRHELGSEGILLVFAILDQHALIFQTLDQTMHRADRHADQNGDVGDAKLLLVVLKAVQHVKSLEER